MMEKQNYSSNCYLITPSLLNAWAYMWDCVDNVKEFESDTISLEDKKQDAMIKARQDFLNALNRIQTPPNEYMIRGIEFEEECYKGNTCISPIIDGGAYQIVGKKIYEIGGRKFLLYGRLDVLKGGVIYDIKRVSQYKPQKYIKSYQHPAYLELFNRAYKFVYLPFDGKDLHKEEYYPDQCVKMCDVINNFIRWLENEGLLDIYLNKWKARA